MAGTENLCPLESDLNFYKTQLLRLEAIIEASLDAIYAIDTDGIIQSWNKAAEQIFGFSKEEIIGKSIRVLAFSEQKEEMDHIEAEIGEVLSDLEMEVLMSYLDGKSYQEIACDLDRHAKSIDNALQRVKRKLEKCLSNR